MLNAQENFMAVVSNQRLVKADAIVILEGDGLARIPKGARLYKEGWAPYVVISGGVKNSPHSITASDMKPALLAAGVPEEAIVLEEESQHTRDQGVFLSQMAQARGWKSLILVASHYHQYRAFLAFLKVLQEKGLDRSLQLISAPARDVSWFSRDSQGRRIDLLELEFSKIETYRSQGHMASYEEALAYLEWQESEHDA